MITFPRAPRVAPGDVIRSADLAGLARALNARLRSGIGDGSWRLHHYFLSLFRSIRNCDASGMRCPSIAEFFEAYQGLPPGDGEWPAAAAGDPEGSNLANPIAAYVHGASSFDDESTRLAALPTLVDGRQPASLLDFWLLGAMQRGGWDPATGALACPAFDAARSYAVIRYSGRSPFGNAYGSWMAQPELLATPCDDPDSSDDYPAPPNWEIKFTALLDGLPDLTYPGTCAPGPDISPPDKYDLHVAAIGYAPWAYYVLLNDGTVNVLATNEYVEGPYTGAPKLRKTPADHWPRVFAKFISDFRGADQAAAAAAAAVPAAWNRQASDLQRFLTRQYLLAPARGNETAGGVHVTYPRWSLPAPGTGSGPGTTLVRSPGDLVVADRCVVSAVFLAAQNLGAQTSVEMLVDGAVAAAFALSPAPLSAQALAVLDTPVPAGAAVAFRLGSSAQFDAIGGALDVEVAEIMDYKPWLHDLMLVHRITACVE